ncbi:spore coat protein [Actinoplanes sp. SE50]|uniref:dTDP-glucose 4,6-dehydratase n=1 Tax=Actinoplanes sp. (strain ATCC 31044 / CBS 674.73 / SE50/110) TaxID=134676 RepID=RMLB_ACTS5|nr:MULTISPECIES: dTDP-glucose 4,6-dehydratase [unclassified Actinoplanes]Q9ZAE8.2 RecName: Full=dTDP-glucose 4,6-dehydratase [Actinoplanes sp. SE50/110]AEV84576.1 dTDP-glucose 4,6-dehydratase [Actinoplanes sp. SE50/110]ATO82968.1 spore coat protein [Actinoplanes sp. SE50]CAA77209.2 dTDP-glucose 4,6-dehydratase AcbB [Actinoplanes sp. SE50/110]SLM00376.1 dTDP-4-keto-6-deoxy-glucose dehydratase [Actinoplanes sp. SE50/110]
MKILVTGGAGFIGSHFVTSLISGDIATPQPVTQVTVVDKLGYGGNLRNLAEASADPRFSFVRGDICDEGLIEGLMARHDTVAHFAAETHVDRSVVASGPFVASNLVGTQVLLDAALRHHIGRFLHVSTDEVYGSIDTGSWAEGHPLAPNSPYAASKAGSDLLALAYHQTHGMDVVVTRCSNNYGPRQFPEKMIPLFVTRLLDGLDVPVYGDGRNIRDWLHVSDHCRGLALALGAGRAGEVYHIGGGWEATNLELTEILLEACGAPASRISFVTDRKGHDRRYSLDYSKIAGELGYRPRVDFTDGIAETVAWYRANRSWWT